ncbi:MAG TPA: hypothetical protein VFC39_13280 [Acidobacteriaceae bacterium]|nr:hypothetical protein [Acidobacteriaceae bacterium]
MLNRSVTRQDAVQLAVDMRLRLPEMAKKHPATDSGRSEYTRAIWNYFDENFQRKYGWTLYPDTEPKKGRVAGEFMTDFALFDNKRGFRIACESEWGDLDHIDWAFDKLRAVKAEIKILVFQRGHGSTDLLSEEVAKRIRPYLAKCGHHHAKHEFYLFIQFDGDNAKLFIWEPTEDGPFEVEQIEFDHLD